MAGLINAYFMKLNRTISKLNPFKGAGINIYLMDSEDIDFFITNFVDDKGVSLYDEKKDKIIRLPGLKHAYHYHDFTFSTLRRINGCAMLFGQRMVDHIVVRVGKEFDQTYAPYLHVIKFRHDITDDVKHFGNYQVLIESDIALLFHIILDCDDSINLDHLKLHQWGVTEEVIDSMKTNFELILRNVRINV